MNATKTFALTALALCGLWVSDARADQDVEPISGWGVWAGLQGVETVSIDAQGNTVTDFTEYWKLFGSFDGLMTEHVDLVLPPSGQGHAEVSMVLHTLTGDTISGHGTVTLEPVVPLLLLFHATGTVVWGNGTGKFAGVTCTENPDVLTFNSLTYKGTCVGGN
jgi:hypothetical protein